MYTSFSTFQSPCDTCNSRKKSCDTCGKYVCLVCPDIPENNPEINKRSYPIQLHALCAECESIAVCHVNSICGLCMKPFHYITDHIAIGDSTAKYDRFDIVVNMNCPGNGVEHGKMEYRYFSDTHTHLIKCGIQDCDLDEYTPFAKQVFDEIVRVITIFKERGRKMEEKGIKKDSKGYKYFAYPRILFHCYAGVSRSVTAAIYYMSKDTGLSTQAIYDMVREKRKVARPNKCFMKILGL